MSLLAPALTLALVFGLAVGVSSESPAPSWIGVLLAAAWAATWLAYLHARPAVLVGFGVLAVALGGWMFGAHAVDRALRPPLRETLERRLPGFSLESPVDARLEEPITVQGRLLQDATPGVNSTSLRMQVDEVYVHDTPVRATGGLALAVAGALASSSLEHWTTGRIVRAPALLRRPARYLNTGVPDQERALARRGIALVGTVKSGALVEVVAAGAWWEEAGARVRAAARRALLRHVGAWDPEAAAVAVAILIGDRAGLDAGVERRLQEAGTYHVIAISGGNIAIFAALVLGLLAWRGYRGPGATLAAIGMLVAYAGVAEGGASVGRATLMAIVYLAVRVIDQRAPAANAVGVTAALLLLANPLAVADVGFWLTFGATAGILLGLARCPPPTGQVRLPATLFLASVCAELALAPISALVFQRVTLAGLVLNFVAIPAMTLAQLAAMVTVATEAMGIPWLPSGAGAIAALAGRALLDSAGLVDFAPWMTWRVPPPGSCILAAYYSSLALAWWASRPPIDSRPRRLTLRLSAVTAGGLLLWIVTAPQALIRSLGDGQLRVTLLDVGQGDAILVEFPRGRRLLVDAGGLGPRATFDVGDRVVGPALRARGITRLDFVAITHGDPDHLGGAASVVRDFEPREIWVGVAVPGHAPTDAVRAEALRARTAWRTLQRGDSVEIDGVALRVLHPPLPDWERMKVRNDDSLVLELRYGEAAVLLTGDIGREIEESLIVDMQTAPLTVIKVPHHGSGTSSTPAFLETVRPRVALISAGRGNPYGHPVPYVLERYRRLGTAIFSTQTDGQVEVTTDGERVEVVTFGGRRWSATKVTKTR